ncbi:hypothetical protein [Bacillus sp. NEB1478]|uniref:hypothetical protein n=1 Tax=Bacillus sp. NEB1478 TaxID=3073816 RepID=UPI002873B377|nr:hypothetical protein [Bacillus sp. NEB1478]WNB91202.1 hypothetical protein RGB74_14995 [Bacillus sp. NEB1478]
MKSSPHYRFFRVIMGGEIIDIDIFQYPNKTTVVISMIFYKNEQVILVSKTDKDRKTAIKLAQQTFSFSRECCEKKYSSPPIMEIPF